MLVLVFNVFGVTQMTQTATLRALHRAACDLVQDDARLSFAVSRLLSEATGAADDTFAGQDDVREEAWAEKALGALACHLCDNSTPEVRAWFLAQGFTF